MPDDVAVLRTSGLAVINDTFASHRHAFEFALDVIDRCYAEARLFPLEVIGDFVIPPLNAPVSRDFQTLHLDFGLPIDPRIDQDVGVYTALYVAEVGQCSVAQTRLVPLAGLLGQRAWPRHEQLVARLIAYGRTHGAWDDADGYSEGSLARIVEAAAGLVPTLPSVKTDPGFLCGMEFDTVSAELAFFQRHGLDVEVAATNVELAPGGLLIFDNLAVAHGRRGIRQPGELHQRVIGCRGLSPTAQVAIRDRVLRAFSNAPAGSAASSTVPPGAEGLKE
jgi:hypothetical protein